MGLLSVRLDFAYTAKYNFFIHLSHSQAMDGYLSLDGVCTGKKKIGGNSWWEECKVGR